MPKITLAKIQERIDRVEADDVKLAFFKRLISRNFKQTKTTRLIELIPEKFHADLLLFAVIKNKKTAASALREAIITSSALNNSSDSSSEASSEASSSESSRKENEAVKKLNFELWFLGAAAKCQKHKQESVIERIKRKPETQDVDGEESRHKQSKN